MSGIRFSVDIGIIRGSDSTWRVEPAVEGSRMAVDVQIRAAGRAGAASIQRAQVAAERLVDQIDLLGLMGAHAGQEGAHPLPDRIG